MTTAAELADRGRRLREERVPYVHATVVRAERPTSAKPGDTALVLSDGSIIGFVGGSCAQASVRDHSLRVLAGGVPVVLRISPTPGSQPAGAVGPGGAGAGGAEGVVGAAGAEGASPGLVEVHNPCLSGGTLEIFLEPTVPPPLVLAHGDSPIAQALLDAGPVLGFEVRRGDPGTPVPEGAVAVVVATHGSDEPALLMAAVEAGVGYVGLVASRRRGEGVLAALGLDPGDRARVHTPAGLDIGARNAREVALSILAEIVATGAHRSPSTGSARRGDTDAPTASATGSSATGSSATGSSATGSSATDPVCGMTVAAVEASLHVEHDGRRVWFCGTGCRDAFLATPGAYATG
ncbi:MAG: XdhC family protein [Actinomycetes bacterium]